MVAASYFMMAVVKRMIERSRVSWRTGLKLNKAVKNVKKVKFTELDRNELERELPMR